MATLTLNLADELKARAEAQASQAGFASLDAYLANLIESDFSIPIDTALEADLIVGLDSGAREMSASDWEQIRFSLVNKVRVDKR
jgi:hypothetical protein